MSSNMHCTSFDLCSCSQNKWYSMSLLLRKHYLESCLSILPISTPGLCPLMCPEGTDASSQVEIYVHITCWIELRAQILSSPFSLTVFIIFTLNALAYIISLITFFVCIWRYLLGFLLHPDKPLFQECFIQVALIANMLGGSCLFSSMTQLHLEFGVYVLYWCQPAGGRSSCFGFHFGKFMWN